MSNPEISNSGVSESVESMENKKEQIKKRMIDLGKELNESRVCFSFPGINPDSYAKIKTVEEEFPGFTTPIDELIERFKQEGMKIILGNHPESGNIYVLPFLSDDIESDSVPPKRLQISNGMDERIKELVTISKKWEDYHNKSV